MDLIDKLLESIDQSIDLLRQCHASEDIITGLEMARKIVCQAEVIHDANTGIPTTLH